MEAPFDVSFGVANFEAMKLRDRRRERRLVRVADEMVQRPDGAWPKSYTGLRILRPCIG